MNPGLQILRTPGSFQALDGCRGSSSQYGRRCFARELGRDPHMPAEQTTARLTSHRCASFPCVLRGGDANTAVPRCLWTSVRRGSMTECGGLQSRGRESCTRERRSRRLWHGGLFEGAVERAVGHGQRPEFCPRQRVLPATNQRHRQACELSPRQQVRRRQSFRVLLCFSDLLRVRARLAVRTLLSAHTPMLSVQTPLRIRILVCFPVLPRCSVAAPVRPST